MPEGMNVEVAHKLSEREKADRARHRWQEIAEVFEVLILAVAAIATAWSGYQAARGDGRQSVLYGQSNRDRFQADAAAALGGQWLEADSSMFNAWLQARAANNPRLETMFVRRFSPEYRSAFEAGSRPIRSRTRRLPARPTCPSTAIPSSRRAGA